MTFKFLAFAMPFVTLALMAAIGFGVSRYNRRLRSNKIDGYGSQLSWHFEKEVRAANK